MTIIQKRIAEAIQQSNLKQAELAYKIKVSQQQISDYLHCKKMPTLETFAKLCAALDEDPAYLLGLEDETGKKMY